MASTKDRASSNGKPTDTSTGLQQNALQSDFNADETRSLDSDERYLVRLCAS